MTRLRLIGDVLSNARVLLASGVVTLAVAVVLFGQLVPDVAMRCGEAAPDTRPLTTPTEVAAFLDACGEAGRAAYQRLQLADLAYPALLATFMGGAIGAAAGSERRARLPLWLLPIGSSAADYLENVAAWSALATMPEPAAAALRVFSVAAAVKWVLGWASWLTLLGLLAMRVRPR